MAETMIERVSAAIEKALDDDFYRDADVYEAVARAAIEALQSSIDSDEFMLAVSERAYDGRFSKSGETYPSHRNLFRAFFDASLNEGDGT